jgi:hypothetical protein
MDIHHHHPTIIGNIEAIDNNHLYLLLLVLLARRRRRILVTPQPTNRQWTGQQIVDNLLNCENNRRIYSQLRMKLDTFYRLRDWLLLYTELKSSIYGGRSISIEEKLVTFIFITGGNASNPAAQERFNRSGSTISKYI